MFKFHLSRRNVALAACVFSLTYSFVSAAEEIGSFATGGYARGLRTHELMTKVDTNGDGMISKDEWIAFQEKVFAMLDKSKTGLVDAKEFVSASGGDLSSFATGGYARGLRTKEMMDTSTTHKGMLGEEEIMFSTGGANRR